MTEKLLYLTPFTPSARGTVILTRDDYSKPRRKELLAPSKSFAGRNGHGHITVRHKGSGHKRRLRVIDFKHLGKAPASIVAIEYDPSRNVPLLLLKHDDGRYSYMIAYDGAKVGQSVDFGSRAEIKAGSSMPLKYIPSGLDVYCVEMRPNSGSTMVRSAGAFAKVQGKENGKVILSLPSGQQKIVSEDCYATIGVSAHGLFRNVNIGKAGRNRWLGKRPTVRGVAMNPVDHPHGGGEGKTAAGRHPCTPWGKPTKGYKTVRRKKK